MVTNDINMNGIKREMGRIKSLLVFFLYTDIEPVEESKDFA